MDGVETRLDAAMKACAAADMPVAMAGMLDFCSDVLQLSLPHGDGRQLAEILTEYFGDCDLLISDHEIEVPRLFVSDMDSTMIGQECIDELADFAGLKDKVAAITERAMQGELDFGSALKERVGLLEGLDEARGAAPFWSPAASIISLIPLPKISVSNGSWAIVSVSRAAS